MINLNVNYEKENGDKIEQQQFVEKNDLFVEYRKSNKNKDVYYTIIRETIPIYSNNNFMYDFSITASTTTSSTCTSTWSPDKISINSIY